MIHLIPLSAIIHSSQSKLKPIDQQYVFPDGRIYMKLIVEWGKYLSMQVSHCFGRISQLNILADSGHGRHVSSCLLSVDARPGTKS